MDGASETPRQILFAAAWRGNDEKVQELIDAKQVDVNAVDDNRVSALRFAAQFGHLDMVRFLLSRGADVNLKARDGMTPLMAAVEQGHAEIVGVLLAAGANVNARAKGTNALLRAREKGHGDLERVLVDAGATQDLGLWATARNKFVMTFSLNEVQGDLFSVSKEFSLAHCISQDCEMSKGIAKAFRDKFGRIDEIKQQCVDVGGVAVLSLGSGRFVYNLVTKAKYFQKPTYAQLESSLCAMKAHMVCEGVKKLAIPRIGCGLDKLEWGKVKNIIQKVFADTDVVILVHSL